MLVILYLISWLTDCAAFLLTFTVSRRLAEMHTSSTMLGLLGALFYLANTLSFAMGHWSDRLGRKKIALTGTVLFFVSVCGHIWFEPAHWMYYVSYTLAGVALGAVWPPIMAWIGQGKRGREAGRVYFIFCLSFNAGIFSGQLAGGWLYQELSPSWPLYVALGLTALDLLLLASLSTRGSLLKEFADPPPDAILSAGFARLAWIANVGGAFALSVVLYLLPKLCVDLKMPAGNHASLLALSRLFTILTLAAMHYFTFWVHRFALVLSVQLLGTAGLLFVACSWSIPGLALGLACLAVLLGYNYFAGLYYSTMGAGADRQGATIGIHEGTLAFGLAGGSLLGGFTGAEAGDRAPFILAACVVASLGILQIVVFRKWRQSLGTPLTRKGENS